MVQPESRRNTAEERGAPRYIDYWKDLSRDNCIDRRRKGLEPRASQVSNEMLSFFFSFLFKTISEIEPFRCQWPRPGSRRKKKGGSIQIVFESKKIVDVSI